MTKVINLRPHEDKKISDLHAALLDVIDIHTEDNNMTVASVIGVLHIIEIDMVMDIRSTNE